MAEGLFREMVKNRQDIEVSSGGVGTFEGQVPSPVAVDAMAELGIDISSHRSKPVTHEMVRHSDYIFVMTYGHLDSMLMLYPFAADRIFLMLEFIEGLTPTEREIDDPIGGSINTYRHCRDQMRGALEEILNVLNLVKGRKLGEGEIVKRIALVADEGGTNILPHAANLIQQQGCEPRAVQKHGETLRELVQGLTSEILCGHAEQGIFIGEDAVGAHMIANRHPGVRAVLINTPEAAHHAREVHDANLLCLDVAELDKYTFQEVIKTWLKTSFNQQSEHHEKKLKTMETTSISTSNIPHIDPPTLSQVDAQVFQAIQNEARRQSENIELIASENFTSRAVMEAQGSCMTNKYAEGYPGKRWYGGCEYVDVVESLAIQRAKELFGSDHVNVQPHSGSQANMAVYFSVLHPGDRILTMDLSHGGHLTHGHKMNFSGRLYEVMHYGVSAENEMIDYDALAKAAENFEPRMITAGASAYSRFLDYARLQKIAQSVGAYLFIDMAHIAGLVAAGVHPSPVPYADFVTTTTHKTLRGPRGGLILCKEKYAKDIDSNVFPGCQGGPLMHVIAAKAVCLAEALQPEFKKYQDQVIRNAKALSEGMKKNGYRIVSGGTDNHLMLVDLQPKGVTGKEAQEALDHAGITVNKNAIPFDKQSPFKAGGIRLGSPAVTTRGMKEDEMFDIANWIHAILKDPKDEAAQKEVLGQVRALTARFPLPY